MSQPFKLAAGISILLILMLASLVHAEQDDSTPTIMPTSSSIGGTLPVKGLTCNTTVEGSLARSRCRYVIKNTGDEQTEVSFNLHLPEDTLLTGFGYYYKKRFIKGEMYNKEIAWDAYNAITQVNRDPGVMERLNNRNYETKIFPVEARRDLIVVVDWVQVLGADKSGLFCTLPLIMPADNPKIDVEATVTWRDTNAADITSNFAGQAAVKQKGHHVVVNLKETLTPTNNLRIYRKRPAEGVFAEVYSGLTGPRQGYYVMLLCPGKELDNPKASLINRIGTGLSMPTAFNKVDAAGRIYITGKYKKGGKTEVVLTDTHQRKVAVKVELSDSQVKQNYAAPLWADKRIAQLESNTRKNWAGEIINLSKQFNVLSKHTALLAIPAEEASRVRDILAQDNAVTNAKSLGGGGGDPLISVKAPVNTRRVVAVFPQGEAKELAYNSKTERWNGRFDIPFGTAPGTYRVTVIVVREDGTRTRFILEYENLLSSAVVADATSLRAARGEAVTLRIHGSGIERAVALSPWGERATMQRDGDTWQACVTVPRDWQTGESLLTVILLDGAHNRTEITVDLQVH